jgi:hypothetical protein
MSRLGVKPIWVPFLLSALILAVTFAFFVVFGVVTGDWYGAWDVLAGVRSPFEVTPFMTPVIVGWPLSFLGYIAVPATIGAVAAGMWDLIVKRRLLSPSEAQRLVDQRLGKRGA